MFSLPPGGTVDEVAMTVEASFGIDAVDGCCLEIMHISVNENVAFTHLRTTNQKLLSSAYITVFVVNSLAVALSDWSLMLTTGFI